MNKQPVGERSERPKSWRELIGPMCLIQDVPESISRDNGLIVLETADQTKGCPMFQFGYDEVGAIELYPDLSLGWQVISSLHIDQLRESPWSSAARLVLPREEFDGHSWADILKDPEAMPDVKVNVYAAMVTDAVNAAEWSGIELTDPRRVLRN